MSKFARVRAPSFLPSEPGGVSPMALTLGEFRRNVSRLFVVFASRIRDFYGFANMLPEDSFAQAGLAASFARPDSEQYRIAFGQQSDL